MRALAHKPASTLKRTVTSGATTAVTNPNPAELTLQQVMLENVEGGVLLYDFDTEPTDANSAELAAGETRILSVCLYGQPPATQLRLKRAAGEASGRVLITWVEGA